MDADWPVVVVGGYASIDEAYTTSRLAGAAETGVLTGPVEPVPRHGGCGPNTARVLARLGVPTGVVTWVGDDQQGREFVQGLDEAGVDTAGVEMGRGPSPRSLLMYDASGDAACYFHPSGSASQQIEPIVGNMVREAGWLVITVGPAPVTESLLEARGPDTRLAWGVKADRQAFPPELCARLVGADLVCLNKRELGFVAEALELSDHDPRRLIERGASCVVLTRGADGYSVITPDGITDGRTEPTLVADATGAGDAFLAGLIAGYVAGDTAAVAGQRAARVARDYLLHGLAGFAEAVR